MKGMFLYNLAGSGLKKVWGMLAGQGEKVSQAVQGTAAGNARLASELASTNDPKLIKEILDGQTASAAGAAASAAKVGWGKKIMVGLGLATGVGGVVGANSLLNGGPQQVANSAGETAMEVQSAGQASNTLADSFSGGQGMVQSLLGALAAILRACGLDSMANKIEKSHMRTYQASQDRFDNYAKPDNGLSSDELKQTRSISPSAGPTNGNDPASGGPDAAGPDNDNGGGLGLGTVAAGAGLAGAGYVGYRALKNRGGAPGITASVANAADDAPNNIGRAAAEASEGGWSSKLRGGFKRSAIGAVILGGATFAGSMAMGSDTAHAAETTAKTVVPFADSFEKAAQGDKTGAARSATIEGVGLAASVGTGLAVGAAVGSVVPVAGTAVGAVVGTVAGVAGYVVGSGVAESAWDSLASYFNGKADPSSAPAPMVTRTDLSFGSRQPALAMG